MIWIFVRLALPWGVWIACPIRNASSVILLFSISSWECARTSVVMASCTLLNVMMVILMTGMAAHPYVKYRRTIPVLEVLKLLPLFALTPVLLKLLYNHTLKIHWKTQSILSHRYILISLSSLLSISLKLSRPNLLWLHRILASIPLMEYSPWLSSMMHPWILSFYRYSLCLLLLLPISTCLEWAKCCLIQLITI